MTFYGAKDLEAAFRTVRGNTITIAEETPAEKYGFQAAPGVMTVGEMLAHLALFPRWQQRTHAERVSFVEIAAFGPIIAQAKLDEKTLSTKDAILAALKDGGEVFASFLGSLSDETLAERVSFSAPANNSKTRFEMLMSVKEHEMHHRGQLMLIERVLGIVPHLTRQREAFTAQMAAQAGAAR
jgi:uncharacterized damage-inducible protein DinB